MSAVIEAEKESATAAEHNYKHLSLPQCIGLGVGGIPDIGMQYAMKSMANPIFNVCYGVDPILIGIAMSLPRFWEIFIDPWIGVVSDRTRGPMGRRHPYMIWGGLLGGVTFALVWFVPGGMSAVMKGWWLVIFALAHFTAYSFFMVPYSALLGEVSPVPDQRMKAMEFRTVFVNLGGVAIGWLYWLCQLKWFANPAEGMKVVGIGFGLVLAAGAILPVFVCKENRKYHSVPVKNEKKLKEFSVIKELLGLREFRGMLLAILSLMVGCLLVSNLGFYISLCYVFPGDTKAVALLGGVGAVVGAVSAIIICPFINYCAKRIGEKPTLYLFMGLALAGNIATYWAANPTHPYAVLITGTVTNFGLTAFWIIMPSITGELSHDYEQRTGKSIYGSFYALYGMAIKIGASVGLLFTGIILNLSGYHATYGATQAAATISMMRILNSALPVLGILIAIYCVWSSTKKAVSCQ